MSRLVYLDVVGVADPYRPEPTLEPAASRILWRPWMARLSTLLVCLAATLPYVYAFTHATLERGHDVTAAGLGLVVLTVLHPLFATVAHSIAVRDGKIVKLAAIKLAWAWLAYPAIGVYRVVRWVARGE